MRRSSPTADVASCKQDVLAPSEKPKKRGSVRFAPGTVFDPPSSPRTSDYRESMELTQRTPPSQPTGAATDLSLGESKAHNSDEEDEEDEDDDW
jgi:hypothetical protein